MDRVNETLWVIYADMLNGITILTEARDAIWVASQRIFDFNLSSDAFGWMIKDLIQIYGEANNTYLNYVKSEIQSLSGVLWEVRRTIEEKSRNIENILWVISDRVFDAALLVCQGLVNIALGNYQHGTDYVPRTGLYKLHQGEQVIPPGKSASTSSNVTVNINGPVYGLDDLDTKISQSISRTIRRGGFAYGFSG